MSIDSIFFKELWKVQEETICIIPLKSYKTIKEELEEASFDVIYKVMEIFDGYRNGIKYNIRIAKNKDIINDNIFCLHDMWYDYIYHFEPSNYMNQSIVVFFDELKSIMNSRIDFILKNEKFYYDNIYGILISITFKIIYKIMELIDGYGKNRIRYELIDTKSGIILNTENCKLLCNSCIDYLL